MNKIKDVLRYDKFSVKLLFVYAFGIALVALARPEQKWTRPYFLSGTALMALGEIIRIWAAGHLRKNQELTASGPYSYVKNPLYIGTILITVGTCIIAKGRETPYFFLSNFNWIFLGIALAVFLFYYIPYKKNREGNRLEEKFGDAWREYDDAVPDYLPRWTPYRNVGTTDKSWSYDTFIENSEHWTLLLVIVLVLIIANNGHLLNMLGL